MAEPSPLPRFWNTQQGMVVNLATQQDSGEATSITPIIASWLSDSCGRSKCTSGGISNAKKEVDKACSSDIFSKYYLALLTKSLLENYDAARTVVCGHSKGSDDYCVHEVLTRLEVRSQAASRLGHVSMAFKH